jgi:hypothetical protein
VGRFRLKQVLQHIVKWRQLQRTLRPIKLGNMELEHWELQWVAPWAHNPYHIINSNLLKL